MSNRIAPQLDPGKKLLLSAVGVAAVAVPTIFGLLHTSQGDAHSQGQDSAFMASPFESVSIKPHTTGEPMAGFTSKGRTIGGANQFKPDRFMATNVRLHGLIARAYRAGGSDILGGPDWVCSENYDIDAKLNTPVIDELSKLGPDQRVLEQRRILQALLADRFRLALHRETREPPAYVLAIAKDESNFRRRNLVILILMDSKTLRAAPWEQESYSSRDRAS